jgi:LPS-assembly protein
MPKLFRSTFIIAVFVSSHTILAANSLCPTPKKPKTVDTSHLPHPSADIYHEAMEAAVAQANETLDWINDPSGNNACGGYYLAPVNPNPQRDLSPDKSDLYMSANLVEKGQDGFTLLSGDVELYQGKRRLRCDTMRYSEELEYSEVKGTIQLREPGVLVLSEEAIFDNLNRTSRFSTTEYVLHDQQAHGKAETISVSANDNQGYLTLEKASFTICPPNAELWSFDTKRIELDQKKGWGKMYSALFEIGNVPVLYIPYIDFPIDDRRKTGLLWPSFSSAGNGGIDLTLPYYFNLAPQADLTYVPRYNSAHGTLHGIETRYKHSYSEWITGGTYLENDERVGGIATKNNPNIDNKRWMAFIKEEGRFNANWSTDIDYQSVSDINYFRDWGTTGFDVKKSLNIERYATINFSNENWKASSTIIDYQSLEFDPATNDIITEEYRRLPTINALYRNQQRNFYYNPIFFSQYTFFDHEERIRAHRLHLAPGLTLPMRWQEGEIVSTFRVKHNEYHFNDSNDLNEVTQPNTLYQGNESITVPTFSMNNRLFFDRDINIGSESFIQTLTPRLYYYYADYEEQSQLPNFDTIEMAFSYQQLFRDNRFGSYDRIGDANQVSLALESELIKSQTGRKLFGIGIGQIFYLQDRRVSAYNTDTQYLAINSTDTIDAIKEKQNINEEIHRRYYREGSDIALEPTWYIDKNQRVTSSFIWDPYLEEHQETAIGYHYRDDKQRIFNVAYRNKRNPFYNSNGTWFTLNDVDQTDVSLYLPVKENWYAYMRWNYDVSNKTTIEDITGVKYEGCCFAVMLAYQRERETFENNLRIADSASPSYNYSWFIQFELKGLGGITNTITHLLEESIEGFKKRESDI